MRLKAYFWVEDMSDKEQTSDSPYKKKKSGHQVLAEIRP